MALKKSPLALFFLSLLLGCKGYAQTSSPPPKSVPETGFLKRGVTLGATAMNYRVYVPRGYDPRKKYPIILYLHAVGEVGSDNEKQMGGVGLGSIIQLYQWKYPEQYRSFIAVFPQTANYWLGDAAEGAVKALDQTVAEFNGDASRLYLSGFSLGGYGSWYLAAKYPGKFAAVATAGGGIAYPLELPLSKLKPFMPAEMFAFYTAQDPYAAFAEAVGKTPVWIFHGEKDDIVPATEARRMEAALKAVEGNVRHTEYADEGHYIADRVYTDAQLWKWLLAQHLAG